jgi:hypothetical protein
MDARRTQRFLAALRERSGSAVAEAEADVVSVRGLTLEQRGERLMAVCRAGWAILRARPDFARAVELRDPPAPDFPAIWARLRARYRARRVEAHDPRGSD